MLTDSPYPVLHERIVEGVVIISVERELKGQGETALRERLDRLVCQGHLQILIDLRAVPYLNSMEIGRLIRSHISVRRAGGRVRLCNLSEKVMTLMRLTRLDTVLDIYSTEEAALAAVQRGDPEKTSLTLQ
ncbi:MAG TPA: STAS domain-containing protein [Acidobacteriota bacterium]|nr:STAS domain-containing protein [Acidobacteriota bacterium]